MIKCPRCNRGAEACQYCENVSKEDFEAMCDCGLYDFGDHLINCEERANCKYIIAADYEAANEPRTT